MTYLDGYIRLYCTGTRVDLTVEDALPGDRPDHDLSRLRRKVTIDNSVAMWYFYHAQIFDQYSISDLFATV